MINLANITASQSNHHNLYFSCAKCEQESDHKWTLISFLIVTCLNVSAGSKYLHITYSVFTVWQSNQTLNHVETGVLQGIFQVNKFKPMIVFPWFYRWGKGDTLTLLLQFSFIQLAFIEGLRHLVLGEGKLLFCSSSSDLNHESVGKVSQLLH